MFDLEQSITEWRQQMLAAGIKTPVPLEELESHLRDDIEQQVRSGVTDKIAFETAVRRLENRPRWQWNSETPPSHTGFGKYSQSDCTSSWLGSLRH